MTSQRLGTGKTFLSICIRQKITRHARDLKLLHIINKSKHPYENKSNTLNTVSLSHY